MPTEALLTLGMLKLTSLILIEELEAMPNVESYGTVSSHDSTDET